MDASELQSLMLSKAPQMPKKARRVAEYLLMNMREAAFRSIGEVAEDLDVSKAQIVRVARILGFDGYSDLKEQLQLAILEQVNPAAAIPRSFEPDAELTQSILRAEHANIDDTWSQITADKVVSFCEMAKAAQQIALMGLEISSLVVEFAYTRMCSMALPAMLMKRGSLSLVEQARTITSGTLMIVCEMPSYSIDVTDAVTEGRSRGAKLITISDSPAAPICRDADLSFYISSASATFGSSITGGVFLMHVLTSALASSLGDRAREEMDRQAEYLKDERFYHPIFGMKF